VASFSVVREKIDLDSRRWQVVAACERICALLLLLLFAPAILACAVAILMLSRRTPFIAHRRVGWRGSTLWMLKLRTMWNPDSSEPIASRMERGWIEFIADDAGAALKQFDDARVPHPFARFCRRHSIDELPQLWHVVRGEMLLVGPRPLTGRELRQHYGVYAEEILQLKPGIAGLWQTSGRNRLSYRQRLALDLEFVRQRSLGMYARIIWRTRGEIWSGANAW